MHSAFALKVWALACLVGCFWILNAVHALMLWQAHRWFMQGGLVHEYLMPAHCL